MNKDLTEAELDAFLEAHEKCVVKVPNRVFYGDGNFWNGQSLPVNKEF